MAAQLIEMIKHKPSLHLVPAKKAKICQQTPVLSLSLFPCWPTLDVLFHAGGKWQWEICMFSLYIIQSDKYKRTEKDALGITLGGWKSNQ